MPKFKHKRYFDVFEYMFILSKGQPRTFNPLTQPNKRAGELYDYTAKLKTTGKVRVKKRLKRGKIRVKKRHGQSRNKDRQSTRED